MAIKFSNLASTTLASGVSSTATSVSVTSASSFPTLGSGDYFYATIGAGSGSEIVKVTGISGTTFTVSRGEDGTTAVSHSAGVDVALRVTAGTLEDLRDGGQVYTAGSGLGLSGNEFTNTAPDQTVSISGSGSTTVTGTYPSFTVSSTSYSHPSAHPISFITGLQTALDGKVDDSQVLTDVPANALFTDTVYTHPTNHSISFITGLQSALDGKVDDSQVLTNVPSGALFTDTVYTLPFTDNSSNWNTAYGWGDHSAAGYLTSHQSLSGYATETYVGTQITNLVDSAPATMDTLNELAAALGDDPNFATTVSNSIGTKLPLAGGTLTGALSGTTATFSGDISAGNLTPSGYISQATGQSHYFRGGTDANWRIGSDITADTGGLVDSAAIQMIVGGGSSPNYGFQIFGHPTPTVPVFEVLPQANAASSITNIRGKLYINNTEVIDNSRNLTNINAITSTGVAALNRGNTSVGPPNTANHDTGTRIELYNASAASWYAIGIESNTMWFNSDNHYRFYTDAVSKVDFDSSGVVNAVGGYKVNGTTFIDASRNITAGTISSGAITSSGAVSAYGNSDTVAALEIYSNSTHGMRILHRGTDGDFSFERRVNGTNTEFLRIGRSTGNATFSGTISSGAITSTGALTLSVDTTDALNFSANTTNDRRGISFNGRTALSADYNDGYLRINDSSEFTSGIFTPSTLRVDGNILANGGLNVAGGTLQLGYTTVIDSSRNLTNVGTLTANYGAVWSETVQGHATGTIHLDPDSGTDHAGSAITFGASDAFSGANAQAGIYARSDGAYGTKLYLSTTDSYASGSKTALSIDHSGNTSITRGALQIGGTTVIDSSRNFYASNYGRTSHHTGYLVGGYNNVGGSGGKSSPIYSIGSAYTASDTSLGNIYGIGYTTYSSALIGTIPGGNDWGMYVAAAGVGRVWLDGANGNIGSVGGVYATNGYHVGTTQVIDASRNLTNIGYFANTDGSKLEVMGGSDGNQRGIYMWDSSDPNWGIYMATAGANNSLAGGTACNSLDGRTGANSHHIRFRTYGQDATRGWIFENNLEAAKVSITSDTGKIYSTGDHYVGTNVVWHAGNDGSGSGLDADTLDGMHKSAEFGPSAVGNFGQWQNHATYQNFNTDVAYWGWNYVQGNINAPNTNTGQWYRNRVSLGDQYGFQNGSSDYWLEMAYPRTLGSAGGLWLRACENGSIGSWYEAASKIGSNTTWHAGNDGSGSGLDADLLDGWNSGAFLKSGAGNSVTGWWISAARNGSGTSPHVYLSHSSGYGMHINTYNTNGSLYALELHNNTNGLFAVHNNGDIKVNNITRMDLSGNSYFDKRRRRDHHTGHLEGSYNNVGGNGAKSNPIYTIGSNYNPVDASLANMYGIGYTSIGASFISGGLSFGDWGMYVAADGDARIFMDGSGGNIAALGEIRGTKFGDIDDSGYYVDPHNISAIRRLTLASSATTTFATPNVMSYASSNTAGAAQYHIRFVANNGNSNGSISTNYYQTTYATTSDYRVKEDFQPMVNATSRLMSLNPVNFQWKDSDMRTDGFLAHEVAEVVSDAVVGEKDAVDEKGNDELQSLDQSKLVPLLVKTIQEQQGVIEELEARISALEA